MKIWIDQNNLVSIQNPNIPQNRQFQQNIGWYFFSDFDKWILVWHKKQIKIVNLKNLWEWMSVFYIKPTCIIHNKFNIQAFTNAVCNYQAFDENTSSKYYFLPKINTKQITTINDIFDKLWLNISLQDDNKSTIINWDTNDWSHPIDIEYFINQLFAWTILYGKFDIRNWELLSFKIHLPLFGSYLSQIDYLDQQIQNLNQNWIFIKKDILTTNNWSTYQISGNDYEILQLFAYLYQNIEIINKITKYEQSIQAIESLILFISQDESIPWDWKQETIKLIKTQTVKLLTK